MSLKSVGKQLILLGNSLAGRWGAAPWRRAGGLLRAALQARVGRPLSKNLLVKSLQRALRVRFVGRPFSAFHWRHLPDQRASGSAVRLRRRLARRQPSFLDRLKDVFALTRYNAGLAQEDYPNALDYYEIGDFIASGCNAAVYELRQRHENWAKNVEHKAYPLALKMMFNYDFSLPERYLWADMGPELIPLGRMPAEALQGRMKSFKPFTRAHPNIIKMHAAFVDTMPVLKDAERLYPDALPAADMLAYLNREPKTLFIVMKRYRMTLREFVLQRVPESRTAHVMLGQLLEAVVFLHARNIAHRDIKSDNVLLDFYQEGEVPHLVLSDFGSALLTGFRMPYADEFADLGGNVALRPPEVRSARPARNTVVDFSCADLWAAGTMAYEMFTSVNPFYSVLSSESYVESALPALPASTHPAVRRVLAETLAVRPERRPRPEVVANTVTLSLFGVAESVRGLVESVLAEARDCRQGVELMLVQLIGLFAAETVSARAASPAVLSAAELQLRATFFGRLQWADLEAALVRFQRPVDKQVGRSAV